MKLLLQEYLSLLKESDELDKLVPDLLLSMSILPLSHSQKGVRQSGVDVAAVGLDPQSRVKTLFLFAIKQGDINRSDWSAGPQAVLPTLDEVRDVYLNNAVNPDHQKLPIKIILCTGGVLKQEVEPNWIGYIKNNQISGVREYEFWGGDQLSILIEKYLFNENVLPEQLRSKFRKTLALISEPDYDFSDYYEILDKLLVSHDFGAVRKQSIRKKVLKALRTVSLCQSIIFYWSKSENNIRPAIHCSERTVLNAWELIRRHDLSANTKVMQAYVDLLSSLVHIYYEYIDKVHAHCQVKDGFSGYSQEYSLECLNIFENLGTISSAGLLFVHYSIFSNDEGLHNAGNQVKELLKQFIINQKASQSPCYDGHVTDISLALYLLFIFKEQSFAEQWICEIVNSTVYSYHHLGKYFPIQTDSFNDLVDLVADESVAKEQLFQLSTLIPVLAQWCVCFELEDAYNHIQKSVEAVFKDCTFQIWYPDSDTDKLLYSETASIKSGNMEAPIDLSVSYSEMESRIVSVQSKTISIESFSSYKSGLSFLTIMASRHFRTPFFPIYWQMAVFSRKNTDPTILAE